MTRKFSSAAERFIVASFVAQSSGRSKRKSAFTAPPHPSKYSALGPGRCVKAKSKGPQLMPFGNQKIQPMPKYVIEREIPAAGKLSSDELPTISQTSCGVLRELGPEIQWVQSFVTDDKVYCVYIAPNEDLVRKHAQLGAFPANRFSKLP